MTRGRRWTSRRPWKSRCWLGVAKIMRRVGSSVAVGSDSTWTVVSWTNKYQRRFWGNAGLNSTGKCGVCSGPSRLEWVSSCQCSESLPSSSWQRAAALYDFTSSESEHVSGSQPRIMLSSGWRSGIRTLYNYGLLDRVLLVTSWVNGHVFLLKAACGALRSLAIQTWGH